MIELIPNLPDNVLGFCTKGEVTVEEYETVVIPAVEAQIKKLPLLFLYTKDINKKAQEMLESEAFKNAIVNKLE